MARKSNTFELGCNAPLNTIDEALQDIPNSKVYHNGVCYVINTPLEINYRELLYRLLVEGIEIEYFRDISRSVKRLFEMK